MPASFGQEVSSHFSRSDMDRIVAETFIEQVDYQREIASTNDRALQLAKEQSVYARLLVLTDKQTLGRGRGANRWWANEGALTFSVLLKAEAISLPPSRWPQLALATGLAVCDAIQDLLGGSAAVGLKWPNDVYLSDRKVCGILVETADGQSARLVLGIGINVNNATDVAPQELRGKAVALCEVARRDMPLVEVLIGVLQRLSSRLSWIGSCENELCKQWRSRCLLTGRIVQIEVGSRRLVGTCLGIDDDGALLIDTDAGRERCLSGVVTHWN
jgi:BirA family biotin operon repressor/biotin-[acetyl-CoA-carboxylase] ligase